MIDNPIWEGSIRDLNEVPRKRCRNALPWTFRFKHS